MVLGVALLSGASGGIGASGALHAPRRGDSRGDGSGASEEAEVSGSMPACMVARAEVRWVPYGYNHVIVLESGCDRAASCEVWTDVNPDHQRVVVKPRTTEEVLTFRASPASTFRATVECRLQAG